MGGGPRGELDGAPVGRRVVLGLLGLGAVGVVAGRSVQEELSHLLAPAQLRDPTGLTSLVPLGNTWRYYSVTGAVAPRAPSAYRLTVSGDVATSATYSYADLAALPQTSFTDTFQCVTGWHVPDVPWSGVRMADLLDLAGPTADAVGVRFRSFDGTYAVNMTLEQARADDVIVALSMYGEPVTHDHGGPVRIYSGSMYGYKSTKWLDEIEVTTNNLPGYWEDRGYPLDGIIGE
ncbi:MULTISPECIES: molybdopterin-dependent oxidoreductase [unclassified Nocardioides]|uniref:molybdopterin-dependent oxidoreductase n=1 Tax=unclassified Nocardioides TaxID=2615069 RepID=UPI0009F0EF8F|nr:MULTISPECIES: molybdopterin-dependent oxidoreductase [unclassified Nocardioides]GAW49489.1 Oxidoreductase molybdopterin binding protein [Nocardioides sp. PD653-B2]GAW54997.1 Oxidoreductase molybdopterin binding protein [Nocardioides sp. PD653]